MYLRPNLHSMLGAMMWVWWAGEDLIPSKMLKKDKMVNKNTLIAQLISRLNKAIQQHPPDRRRVTFFHNNAWPLHITRTAEAAPQAPMGFFCIHHILKTSCNSSTSSVYMAMKRILKVGLTKCSACDLRSSGKKKYIIRLKVGWKHVINEYVAKIVYRSSKLCNYVI